jgi:hypothetical protein
MVIVQRGLNFVIWYLTSTYVQEQRTAELHLNFLVRFPESINQVTYLVQQHYDVRINYSQAETLNESIFCGFIHWTKICGFFTGKQGRQCTYKATLRRVRATIVTAENNKYYTTWVCVFVALGIQHAMRMHHGFVCGLPRSTIFFHIIS